MKIKNKSLKKIVVGTSFIILLAGMFFGLLIYQRNKATISGIATVSSSYPHSDKDRLQNGDSRKDEIIKDENFRNNPDKQNSQTANVIITDAGQYDNIIEVRAFIPNHYQDGVCTISLALGDKKIEKSMPAYRDVSTTICSNPLFARSEIPSAGDWEVTVRYESSSTSGTSEVKVINIK